MESLRKLNNRTDAEEYRETNNNNVFLFQELFDMAKKIRKGTLVICSLYGGDIAKINYYNPLNGEVGLRYKGSKCEYSANINDCKIV